MYNRWLTVRVRHDTTCRALEMKTENEPALLLCEDCERTVFFTNDIDVDDTHSPPHRPVDKKSCVQESSDLHYYPILHPVPRGACVLLHLSPVISD